MKWDHLAIVLLKFFQTLSPRALRAASRCLGNLEACQAQLPASFGLRYCSNALETHLIEIHVGQGRARTQPLLRLGRASVWPVLGPGAGQFPGHSIPTPNASPAQPPVRSSL